jgi:hypothetical protein
MTISLRKLESLDASIDSMDKELASLRSIMAARGERSNPTPDAGRTGHRRRGKHVIRGETCVRPVGPSRRIRACHGPRASLQQWSFQRTLH